jgi:glycosyltransferase involved in cell wall biosynthesis
MTDVSVIVPSYNHAPFLVEAVKGTLNQTHAVEEVVVVDDGSRDASLSLLKSITDPRLKVVALPENRGGAEALNVGIRATNSPLLAICNSDDVWEPNKLEVQLRAMARSPGTAAVFTHVKLIGEKGERVPRDVGLEELFAADNRTRHAWIRRFLEIGNCLCHPSVLIKREVYEQVGLYDNRYRQLPDFHMWLRVVQKYDIEILPDRLICFRVHANTSRPSPAASTRDTNEFADIALEVFRGLSADNFYLAFGARRDPSDSNFRLAVEKVLYLWSVMSPRGPTFRWIAGQLAMELLANADGREAWRSYGFSVPDFHTLRGIFSPWLNVRENIALLPDEADVIERILGANGRANPGLLSQVGVRSSHGHKRRREIRFTRKLVRETKRIGAQIFHMFTG